MKVKNICILVGLVLVFSSCKSYHFKTDKYGNKRYYNIRYGKHKAHKMDVFVPRKKKDSTFVIIVHGGAWKMGDKRHIRSVQRFLLKNGIPSANINYRLVKDSITYQHQVEDIGTAAHYILDSLPYKPQLVLLGESSGGHISMLYGYNNPAIIDKIITFAGPADFYSKRYHKTNFYKWYTQRTFANIVGKRNQPLSAIHEELKKASPISQVSNVPTLTFQGTNDVLVNKNQSLALDSVLTRKNIPHELVLIKGANHTPRFMPWWRNKIIYPKILSFLEKNFLPAKKNKNNP